MKKFFNEFKTFITRGNVLDMAVGVIVGGAFTAIVNALGNNILKPIINFLLALVFGKDSLSELFTFLKRVEVDGVVDLTQSIYIDWGSFINAIINFIIIAFVLFCLVKALNAVADAQKKMFVDMDTQRVAYKKYRKEGLPAKRQGKIPRRTCRRGEAAKKQAEEEKANEVTDLKLLAEIRDLLKQKNCVEIKPADKETEKA
ncbi:MAG: large conductance mechanosensitive channel protein MscL [Christensenellales bacterium]